MAYAFPGGPITMAEIVRYANEHGMYFANRPVPFISSTDRARGRGEFTSPYRIVASAKISASCGIASWVAQGKYLSFTVVATAWGILTPKTLLVDASNPPFRLGLSILWDGEVVAEGYPTYGDTPPEVGMQNDPQSNFRAAYHMQYALSYADRRQAVSTDAPGDFEAIFEVELNSGIYDIDDTATETHVEIGLLDIVEDVVGLV